MSGPRIFVSAVSQELRSARLMVRDALRLLGYETVSQDDFPTGHGELLAWLREQIDSCEGVIQLVGQGYGAEPPTVDPEYGRISYTQFELRYGIKRGKKTWVIVAGDHCKRDKTAAELDLPPEPCADPAAYQRQRQELQRDYMARLRRENHLWHDAADDKDIKLQVMGLRDQLALLRRQTQRQVRQLKLVLVGTLVGLLAIGAGGWWAYRRLHADTQAATQAAVITTEKIRAHLLETVEQTHQRELAQADKAPDWRERQRLRNAADDANKRRLEKIDDLAASFADIEGKGTASGVFQEMARILSSQGVDEAISYVASQRQNILQDVRQRAAAAQAQNRTELLPLLKSAGLCENEGDAAQARGLYHDILAAEPDWPDALAQAFWFYTDQGDAQLVRRTLADAQSDYEQARQLAQHLVTLDPKTAQWRHDLSVACGRLGIIAAGQGKLDEAARNFNQGLALDLALVAEDPNEPNWQRDLTVTYNELGDVASSQGRMDQAARDFADSLAVRRKLAAADPQNTKLQVDLSISCERVGDAAMAQGKMDDAAKAYAEELAISQALVARDPSNADWQADVANAQECLGNVAVNQGKLDDAMKVFAQSLDIRKKLAAGDPGNMQRQSDLAVSYDRVGDAADDLGHADDAARAYAEESRIVTALAAADPGNTLWQRDSSITSNKLGDMAFRQNKFDEAATDFAAALAIAVKLAASDPSNMEWQRDVEICGNQQGDVAVRQGKLDAAAAAYGQGLAIARKLAALDPANIQWQDDVHYTLERLAGVLVSQGKLDDAAGAYQESLTITKKLVAADPANTKWQRGLWMSDYNLAVLAERQKQPGVALGYWKDAQTVIESIQKSGGYLSPQDQKTMALIAQKVSAATKPQ